MADKPGRPTAAEKARAAADERLQAERIKFNGEVARQAGRVTLALVVCTTLAYLGHCFRDAVGLMAGRETNFRAILDWAFAWNVRDVAALLALLLGGASAWKAGTYKREARRLAERNAELEHHRGPKGDDP